MRREDEKRLLEEIRGVAYRDLPFLHRLQERALHLRRGAVNLVGKDDVSKNRPFLGRKGPVLLIENHRADKVCRKKVGGELNALELRVYGRCERFYGESFGEARHPLQQNVPPAEQPDEESLHHVLLPDDDPVDLVR